MRKIIIFFALFINLKFDTITVTKRTNKFSKAITGTANKTSTLKKTRPLIVYAAQNTLKSKAKANIIRKPTVISNIATNNKPVNKNKTIRNSYTSIPVWFHTLDFLLERSEIKAFLDTIAYAEGTLHSDGYRTMYGNYLFYNFRDHPRKVNSAILGRKTVKSSAAGRYQILTRTWDGLNNKFNFKNFKPTTQDKAALALAREAGALNLILTGQIDKALVKLNKIWSSLPGAIYGQPTVRLDKLRNFYNQSIKYYRLQ